MSNIHKPVVKRDGKVFCPCGSESFHAIEVNPLQYPIIVIVVGGVTKYKLDMDEDMPEQIIYHMVCDKCGEVLEDEDGEFDFDVS